jgi:LacI family gluconate utilization system Gnt-I transcriptional repressor
MALGAELLDAALQLKPAPDALFFCNDDIAQGALLEALRRGLQVPQRVAITGFNDLPGSDQMVPPLTTIRTPRSHIGTEGARMLLKLIRGDAVERPNLDLGYELVVRKSS